MKIIQDRDAPAYPLVFEMKDGAEDYYPGLTKLEHFTGVILAAMINRWGWSSKEKLIKTAVMMAKETLLALEKENE